MTDKRSKQILKVFSENGIRIEIGARYSVKGQIAGLLNGTSEIMSSSERLCQIYFRIASEAFGEKKVRELRDKTISLLENDGMLGDAKN